MSKMKDLGEFEVKTGKVIVSDPCYERPEEMGHRLNGELRDVKNGSWYAKIVEKDNRVAKLICYYHDNPIFNDSNFRGWTGIMDFEVAVDSGQAGVFDSKYYKDDEVVKTCKRKYKGDPINPEDKWYSICCDRTLSKNRADVIPFGAVSSTGYGDGCYIASIKKDKNKIVGIIIDFGIGD